MPTKFRRLDKGMAQIIAELILRSVVAAAKIVG
jgi:hypothetical protein